MTIQYTGMLSEEQFKISLGSGSRVISNWYYMIVVGTWKPTKNGTSEGTSRT
jgi:hypothetical protein